MIHYLVTHITSRQSWIVTLDQAAILARIERDELVTALEERGLCETDTHTICEILVGCTRMNITKE